MSKAIGAVVVYRDDGPSGMCGQTVQCSHPHRRAWLCHSEEQARQIVETIAKFDRQSRINARWDIITPGDEDGLGELVDMTNVDTGEE